ncbi:MAG: xanthine dehydrogenase family protein subunit M [Deltaproteobacteria bacterium]|nr:xanthine dehydrogenase family protein subunit M [Deltaproteobacteria bacterium]MBI2539082.1 xanthine dehydrogenase family protein subunit M [Deltaproteobacteria bacterium]MBI3063099.1 xanthine dehydrogenase family protein subunit M [Deltaproteobacteria bacterium]
MIPFEYRTPKNIKEVHQELKQFGTEAKLVAGGTALVIMMKQRLVRPSCLVSLRSVRGLGGIAQKDGGLRIGGLTTHREVETSSLVRRQNPLLAETYRRVATIRVRNMATVGGGLAHADPNQDPPPTLIALGASVKVTSANGSRTVPLDGFFTDYYETVLKPDEIITEIFVPRLPPNSGGAFLKFLPRTADDYATVSAAAVLTLDKARKTFTDVRIALGSVGTTPIRAREAEAILRGQPVKAEALREAAEKAKQLVDPVSDFRGSAAYKREMAGVFVRRALEAALNSLPKKSKTKPSRKPLKRRKK